MKIENAIILAAGRGSRLKELTDYKPKCMQIIQGKPVIERLIEVLKLKGINDITVVVGYKHEKLQYLKRKYNVEIVYNELWKTTNSISSIYKVSSKLHNTIIVDSDIYINNIDAIKNEVNTSGHTAVRVNRPNEWQLLADENNYLLKVAYNGEFVNGLPILDISYWLEPECKIIYDYLHTVKFDVNKYWDEIPCFDCFDKMKLYRHEINENDALEFDTKEELLHIRKILRRKTK